MEENPLEKQQQRLIALREDVKRKVSAMFDDRENLKLKLNELISEVESLSNLNLGFDSRVMIHKLNESFTIKDRDVFVDHMLKTLEPLILLKATDPMKFGISTRESILNDVQNIRLSEVLYVTKEELNSKSEKIHIHLTFAKDFMTRDKITDFKTELNKGLIELARKIKNLPHKKEIWATSWLVASSSKKLEELGFTIIGPIGEEERKTHFHGDNRPIFKALMTQKSFLAKYGSSDVAQ